MAHILLVDDDPDIRYVAARVLKRGAHEVTVFDRPLMALAFFENGGGCDLIVCDRMMPAMNGLAFLTALRARKMPQPRFIFLSARALEGEIAEALAAGADAYLPKPFEPKDLLATIARLLGAAQ